MLQPKQKLRFAPSPNGFAHIGHAYSALLNEKVARGLGAEFIIRMEDFDLLRCTDDYKRAWVEDLGKLGVVSDAEIIYQSERQVAYAKALEKLFELGVLYPCLASRGDIKRHYKTHTELLDPDGALIYPGLYKNLSLIERQKILVGNAPFTLRLDMVAALKIVEKMGGELSFLNVDLEFEKICKVEFDPLVWGDVVIARKDFGTSYHLSVVVDDAWQDIGFIIRGMDLYKATYIHRVLQILLGLPAPVYYHHELILDDELRKLAKSGKSQPIREMWAKNQTLGFNSDLLKPANMRRLVDKIVVIVCKNYG